MNKNSVWWGTVVIFLLCVPFVFAQENSDYIVSNSDDWKDVYSTIMFANLEEKGSSFLASEKHASILLGGISKGTRVFVVTSEDNKFALGFPGLAQSQGFPLPEEMESDNINLDLAELLPGITNFVVIDGTLGYDAISVAPYARLTNAYVLFADASTIGDVDDFLTSRNPSSVLIVGQVDTIVQTTLSKYNLEVINEGNRFSNNLEIVKRYRQINPTKQVILTNGEFLEKEIMSGVEPVIFIGRQEVQPQTKEYVQNSDIEVGVLIGNELIGPATAIRRELGISTFVKFARGARNPSTAIANVEGLDLFFLPIAETLLQIETVRYNRATQNLEVTYSNPGNLAVYFKGTITVETEGGEQVERVGEIDPIFIGVGDIKTVTYPDMVLGNQKYFAKVFTLFGETPQSLDKALDAVAEIQFVEVLDACEIDLKSVTYYKSRDAFYAKVKNIGPLLCYVDVEVLDVVISGQKQTLSMEGSTSLRSGKTKKLKVRAELERTDIEDNEFIDVRVLYGQREDALTKQLMKRLELKVVSFDIAFIAIWIVILALLWILFLLFKKGKKCPKCKKKNSLLADKCAKCHYKF